MKIDILTIFPEMFQGVFSSSILGRAVSDDLLQITLTDIRPFSASKHKNTDDYPFGGGAGMVMMAQPIMDAMASVTGEDFHGKRIFLGPRGKTLTTDMARALAKEEHLVLLCGHYEGFDERIFHWVDEKVSIGDYVLTGGELPALIITDAVSRFIPGVLGKSVSAEDDSFASGLLEYPQYTRPDVFEGLAVPEVLRNGDHGKIAAWRLKKSLLATYRLRRDLLSDEQIGMIEGTLHPKMCKTQRRFWEDLRQELAGESEVKEE